MHWNYITLLHQNPCTGPPPLNWGIKLSCDSPAAVKKIKRELSTGCWCSLCEGLLWLVSELWWGSTLQIFFLHLQSSVAEQRIIRVSEISATLSTTVVVNWLTWRKMCQQNVDFWRYWMLKDDQIVLDVLRIEPNSLQYALSEETAEMTPFPLKCKISWRVLSITL